MGVAKKRHERTFPPTDPLGSPTKSQKRAPLSPSRSVATSNNVRLPPLDPPPVVVEEVLRIGTNDLPSLMRIGRLHPCVRRHVQVYARVCMDVLVEHHEIEKPNSLFRDDIVPTPFSKYHEVYQTFLHDTLIKLGSSHDTANRKEDTSGMRSLLRLKTIETECDKKLVDIWSELINTLIALQETPYDLKCLLKVIRQRGGGVLGFAKVGVLQLVEIGAQLHAGVGAVAECFGTDLATKEGRAQRVIDAITAITPLLRPFIGRLFGMMSSWNTGGKKDHRLESENVVNEYILVGDKEKWEDAIAHPAVADARTTEEIFSKDFDDDAMKDGKNSVIQKVVANKRAGGLLLLDSQESLLFPGNTLDTFLVDQGYRAVAFVFGCELVFYIRGNNQSAVLVNRPYCLALDSQKEISMRQSLLRFLTIEVCACTVRILRGKEVNSDTMAESHNALTAASMYEMTVGFWHLSKYIGCAVGCDILTPSDVWACKKNGLGKCTAACLVSLRSRCELQVLDGTIDRETARERNYKDANALRPVDYYVVRKGKNILSFATFDTISECVHAMDDLFVADGPKRKTYYKHCEYLLQNWLVQDSLLHGLVVEVRDDEIKKNAGNRQSRIASHQEDNNDDFENMCKENGNFCIREFKAESDEDRQKDVTYNPNDHKVYKNIAKLGVKTRFQKHGVKWSIRFATRIPKKEKRQNGFVLC